MQLLANISTSEVPISGVMFAAGVESFFIFLVIVAISSFFQWLKNKREGIEDWSDQESPPVHPGRPASSPPPRKKIDWKTDWEEELRRMLEGDQPAPRPPRPVPPVAPPVIPPRHTHAPPPISKPSPSVSRPQTSMAVPKVFTQPKIYKAHCENCEGHLEFPSNMLGDTIVCPHCFQRTVLQPYGETRVEQLRHKSELSTFKESASAIQRAQNMDELVASRLEAVTQKPVGLTEAHAARKRSAEIEQVISMLRKPHTARAAVVASSILGIPKALES